MLTSDSPFLIAESQRREVDRLLEEGLLDPLLPGVAGPVGCGTDRAVRVSAVALAVPARVLERAALAQAVAAWVWCGGPPPHTVDVAVAPGRMVPRLPLLAVHERRMPPQDVAHLPHGAVVLTLTTPTRTIVDLLRMLPEAEAVPAVAALADLPGVTAPGLAACLERMPRARGVPRARRLASLLPLRPGDPPGPRGPDQSMRLPVIR